MSEREHERLIQESRERTELLDLILEALAVGVAATDLDGRVLFANPAARGMLGMTEESLTCCETSQKLPDHVGSFDLRGAVADCAKERECAEAMVEIEGSPLRVRLRRLKKFDDHRGGVLVVMHLLLDVWRLAANQQRFLSVAAHEIRTPLTTILGSAELLRDEKDPETMRRFLGHIENEARRASDLSETLLRLATLGYDQRKPRLEEVCLLAAAHAAAERLQPLASGAGVKLRVEGEGYTVRADRDWLEQVLLAVLDNAVKYSDRGGVVRLRVEETTVTVEDEGAGISGADLPRVFEPFHRGGRGDEHSSFSGAGLGLPVVRDLVEKMGGGMSVESEEGTGTTVKIEFPKADPP